MRNAASKLTKARQRGKDATQLEADASAAKSAVRQARAKLDGVRDAALASVAHYVEITAAIAKDIPADLLKLWQPHRQLDDFESVAEIVGRRHRIHKVANADGSFSVVKEYPCVGDARARKNFFRELQRLHALRHPCVMEVEAIFVDGERCRFAISLWQYWRSPLHGV
jgi:hypothetical protein